MRRSPSDPPQRINGYIDQFPPRPPSGEHGDSGPAGIFSLEAFLDRSEANVRAAGLIASDAARAEQSLPLQRRQVANGQESERLRPDTPDESSGGNRMSSSPGPAKRRSAAATLSLGDQLGEMSLLSPGVVMMGPMKNLPHLNEVQKARGATATGVRRDTGSNLAPLLLGQTPEQGQLLLHLTALGGAKQSLGPKRSETMPQLSTKQRWQVDASAVGNIVLGKTNAVFRPFSSGTRHDIIVTGMAPLKPPPSVAQN